MEGITAKESKYSHCDWCDSTNELIDFVNFDMSTITLCKAHRKELLQKLQELDSESP